MKLLLTAFISTFFICTSAQSFSGKIISKNNQTPVEYANIGILNKNIGTTSDTSGNFSIYLPTEFNNDTLRISCIGFETKNIIVKDFVNLNKKNIQLFEKTYNLAESVITPKRFKEKVLGNKAKSKSIQAGFDEHLLGKEMGVILAIRKSAKIKKINLNIATCNFDTIFYRINVYEVKNLWKRDFENVLKSPLYISIPKDKVKSTITIDVENKDIWVNGNCLVTIEYVKDLGKGQLHFCAGIGNNTYHRTTSQGKWTSTPIGIGINVLADVEY
ncbi:MAG: carboxypeptidase-like regulatory domain-containing protein [Paludibacter sp.]